LSALPLGQTIVYSNILAQLAVPAVDLTKAETQCFILQAVQQVGSPGQNVERAGHGILTEEYFGLTMLEQLGVGLGRIEKNWESFRALATFSLLARRVLSMTSAEGTRDRAFRHLVNLRHVCLQWLSELKQRTAISTNDEQRTELFTRATEIALLCISTYNVEDADFDTVLKHSSAVSALIQASIIVQENHDSAKPDNPDLFKGEIQSWKSLMYRMLPKLRKNIFDDSRGLSEAVAINWAAFKPASTSSWTPLPGPQEHWLQITSGTLPVHINLLTGELLVNGLPLARLPSEFMNCCLYAPLFGKSTLEVVPTDEPSMRFSAKTPYRDYTLHFGISGQDMLIVAIGDNTRLDLLPARALQNRLPHAFINNYIHWYDHTRDEVIFRPRETPWQSAAEDWRLTHDQRSQTWRLVKGSIVLVDLASRSARQLSKLFQSLEDAQHVHVKLDTATRIVDVEIPRLQLDFYVRKGDTDVHSRQHRGKIVDTNQSIGALVGLVSKLVLKDEHTTERVIVIPVPSTYGRSGITYANGSSPSQRAAVTIRKEVATKVYTYTLDETLGRIVHDGSMQSQLYLGYLHAITSESLPDPLTQRTGTEASLEILQSAAVRSFDVLTQENVELLGRIAGLSAKRSFYPQHLRDMQQITWDKNLLTLSQHPSFRVLVCDILQQAMKTQLFYPDNKVFDLVSQVRSEVLSSSSPYLDQRDALRSSSFRVAGFGAESYSMSQDVRYKARDLDQGSERGRRAFIAATLILRDQTPLHYSISDLKDYMLREYFNKAAVFGVKSSFDSHNLRYDSQWLGDSSKHLLEKWCSLHRGLANAARPCNRYDLATWLCTMSYASSADMKVIQALAAFYRVPDFATIQPPAQSVFNLDRGSTWKESAIRSTLLNNAKSYQSSAEARLPKQGSETNSQHASRIHSLFQHRQNQAINKLFDVLRQQWPVPSPSIPPSSDYDTYFNTSAAIIAVREHFRDWYSNRLFLEYLAHVSTIMTRQPALAVPSPRYILTSPYKKDSLGDDVRHFSSWDIFEEDPPSMSMNSLLDPSINNRVAFLSLMPPREPEVLTDQHFSAKMLSVKDRLQILCSRLEGYAVSGCEQDYVEDLRSSCTALEEHNHHSQSHVQKALVDGAPGLLQEYLRGCQNYFNEFNFALEDAVEDSSLFSNELDAIVKHSPRISPTFWLSQLHRDRFHALSFPWQEIVIEYGLAITNLHRAQRLVRLSSKTVDLVEELGHVGHTNWDVWDHPETLLLEAESGILVREEQEYIASHMRSPQDDQNIVMQLQMGGGKSTTIVPIVSAFHGDKKK
jgi:hypothetical protein